MFSRSSRIPSWLIKKDSIMDKWFEEKSSQVSPSSVLAFGITLSSRYGHVDELIEMMEFAKLCAVKKVENYVKSVFYNSKSGQCSFELDPSVQQGDSVAEILYGVALETIGYFDWFDSVEYGKPMQGVFSKAWLASWQSKCFAGVDDLADSKTTNKGVLAWTH